MQLVNLNVDVISYDQNFRCFIHIILYSVPFEKLYGNTQLARNISEVCDRLM